MLVYHARSASVGRNLVWCDNSMYGNCNNKCIVHSVIFNVISGRSHPIQSQNIRRSKTVQPKRSVDAFYETATSANRSSLANKKPPAPGRVGDVDTQNMSGDQPRKSDQDVEEAQEVTVAPPDVQALRSLNQNQSGHRHLSRPQLKKQCQSGDTTTHIQMDDMSETDATRRKPALRRLAAMLAGGGRTRSISHSPVSATRRPGERRYHSSNSSSGSRQQRVVVDACGRAASCPMLHHAASDSNINVEATRRPSLASTTKRKPNSVPKTLAPAPVPPLSLVSSYNATSVGSNLETSSPVKILPPSTVDTIHNLGDSMSGASLSSCRDDMTLPKPLLNVGARAAIGESEVSAMGVACAQRQRDGTAVKQLNVLAQVMSRHCDDDNSAEDTTLSEDQTSFLE